MPAPPIVLSIAGYDPSSGAGVTADIKTAAAFGCYAVTCITALTVQTTQGVFGVEPVRPELVRETLGRLQEDVEIAAVRVGMLGSGAVAGEVARFLEGRRFPKVVLDPVLRSSSGASLLEESGLDVLRNRLLPLADLVTPNGYEAAILAGIEPPRAEAGEAAADHVGELAVRLHGMGARRVLVTGGDRTDAVDYLSIQQEDGRRLVREFAGEHLASRSTHGTGCALATALACLLARGTEFTAAVAEAKTYVSEAIRSADRIGRGTGPLQHLYRR